MSSYLIIILIYLIEIIILRKGEESIIISYKCIRKMIAIQIFYFITFNFEKLIKYFENK